MQIHEKIKSIREDKKMSQSFIAFELGLDQSQYSRRENGEIDFTAKELLTLSRKLEIPVSKLYDEETTVFNNIDQKGGNFGQYVSISEKLIEQYDLLLLEKDKRIMEKDKRISELELLIKEFNKNK